MGFAHIRRTYFPNSGVWRFGISHPLCHGDVVIEERWCVVLGHMCAILTMFSKQGIVYQSAR